MKPYESSASSHDEFDNYWPYEPRYINNYRNNRDLFGSRHPFYPTMGQPVIYCAQDTSTYPCEATPRTIKNRSRDHRRGPNCFVKAFRWYTQEHVPASRCTNSVSPRRDISSFAAWLDVKYDQFLEESQMGSEMYHFKVRQTIEAERGPTGWKKKRRAKSNDGGVIQQRSNHSCQYIMKPRKEDMSSRPPSVCCNPSCATTAGSESHNKSMCKSHSFSNITLTIQDKDIDGTPTAQGDMGDKPRRVNKPKPYASPSRTSSNTSKKTCSNTSLKNTRSNTAKKVEASTTNRRSCEDFCCQCEKETAPKRHAETQYESEPQAYPNVKLNSVTHKSESPDCSCQKTAKDVTNSQVYYESILAMDRVLPCQQGATCECKPEQKASQKAVHNDSFRSVSKVYKSIECQCSRENVVTVDAQTQYSARPRNTNNKCDCDTKEDAKSKIECLCGELYLKLLIQRARLSLTKHKGHLKSGLTDLFQATSRRKVVEKIIVGFVRGDATPVPSLPMSASRLCPCEGKVMEVIEQCVKFAQTTSQTSSHSIYIEKKTGHEYPLFLKIVCADKLSRENVK